MREDNLYTLNLNFFKAHKVQSVAFSAHQNDHETGKAQMITAMVEHQITGLWPEM